MRASRSICVAVACSLALTATVSAGDDPPGLVERVYHLGQRPAAAAIERVCPLLSARGSVEVQDNGRVLVVRDLAPVVERALEELAELDRAGRTLRLSVQIVSAAAQAAPGVAVAANTAESTLELPAEVVDRLERLLRYRSYSVLARAEREAVEDVTSTFEIGPEYRVGFRLDRGAEPRRVRMSGFRILRETGRGDLKPLVQTHLSLELGRPMILGLAPTEASARALMVVLVAEPEGTPWEARG